MAGQQEQKASGNAGITLPSPVASVLPSFDRGALTAIYGGPGTGKTCLCLMACVEAAADGGKIVYIDTESSFSVERVKQLLGNRMPMDKFLKAVEIVEPDTLDRQAEAIESLSSKDCSLIVVDSLVSLYRLEYSNQDEVLAASRKLSKQLASLAILAKRKGIPVIVTAHTYKNRTTGADEMLGGEVLKYWSKAILFLERTDKMSERIARLSKHRHLPEGGEAKFMLVESGIAPVRFKLF